MNIVGYSNRLSAAAGEPITTMVSTTAGSYRAELVRLMHGDANPAGPGVKILPVRGGSLGVFPGVAQTLRRGSYLIGQLSDPIAAGDGLSALLWFFPTAPDAATQTLLALQANGRDWLRLDLCGANVRATIGETNLQLLETGPLVAHQWYRVAAVYDPHRATLLLELRPRRDSIGTQGVVSAVASAPIGPIDEVLVAARRGRHGQLTDHYNGKIGAPTLYDRVLARNELDGLGNWLALGTLAGPALAWDLSIGIETRTVTDRSGHDRHGTTVQRPMRGATGPSWTGRETAWRHSPSEYDAIHFHDDDLDDAGWEPSFHWPIPDDLPSGVYAVRLSADAVEDHVPVVVRPRPGGTPGVRVCLVIPTFTYLAYANEQVLASDFRDSFPVEATLARAYPSHVADRYVVTHRLLSLYDRHTDGSGVCYSSRLRPIVNMRPGYVVPWLNDGYGSPYGLNADLHLVDWLDEIGSEVDVVTDEDLHREGEALLAPYRVVLTGTHPEYASREMIEAVRKYTETGGRLMYLGGNGMYWATATDPEDGHTIEIRRRGPATRVWEPAAGEAHLSFTGELGGIWKFRGHTPQAWLGVGFGAQGLGPGRPYIREPASYEPDVAWVFAGLDDSEPIGDFPSLVNGYGAAGYEIDRADRELGTPADAVMLASATGFSNSYQAVSEEILEADSLQSGPVNDRVRSDLVLLSCANGGAVFSVGSISWCACLSYNGYDNSVAQVTRNVLERFMQPANNGPVRRTV
jgi:N,N-dimethylformamidase